MACKKETPLHVTRSVLALVRRMWSSRVLILLKRRSIWQGGCTEARFGAIAFIVCATICWVGPTYAQLLQAAGPPCHEPPSVVAAGMVLPVRNAGLSSQRWMPQYRLINANANLAAFQDAKASSKRKLQEIQVALANYHAQHKHFPPSAVIGPDGRTLHSWRVEILPLLLRQDLFDRYKMDEPWDSDHNRTLIKDGADVFRVPNGEERNAPDACEYFLVTGPSTLFDGKSTPRASDVRDGTTNTIGLVEAQRPIPWTKPEDVKYDPKRPLPKLGGFFIDGFHVGFLNSSVVFLPKDIDEKTLRAMFTSAGGEPLRRPSGDTWPRLAE